MPATNHVLTLICIALNSQLFVCGDAVAILRTEIKETVEVNDSKNICQRAKDGFQNQTWSSADPKHFLSSNATTGINCSLRFLQGQNIAPAECCLHKENGSKPLENLSEPTDTENVAELNRVLAFAFAAVFHVISYFAVGTQFRIETVRRIFKRPWAITLMAVSSYVVTPAVCYGVGFMLRDGQEKITYFLTSMSPTAGFVGLVLFDVNVHYSLVDAAGCLLFSVSVLPLLRAIFGPQSLHVDLDIIAQLSAFVLNCPLWLLTGFVCQLRFEWLQESVQKRIRPTLGVAVLGFLVFGIIELVEVSAFVSWQSVISALLFPYLAVLPLLSIYFLMDASNEEFIAALVTCSIKNFGIAAFCVCTLKPPSNAHVLDDKNVSGSSFDPTSGNKALHVDDNRIEAIPNAVSAIEAILCAFSSCLFLAFLAIGKLTKKLYVHQLTISGDRKFKLPF